MPASICEWTAVWVKSFSWLWLPHSSSELEAVCTSPQVQLRAISKMLLLLLYRLAVLSWIPGERWELCEQQFCLSLRVFLTMGTNADLLLTCCWLCPISTWLWNLSDHTFQPCGFYVHADTSCARKQLIFEQSLVPHGSLHTSCPHNSHHPFLSTSVLTGKEHQMALPIFCHSLLPFLQLHVMSSPIPHCSAPFSSVIWQLRSSICCSGPGAATCWLECQNPVLC